MYGEILIPVDTNTAPGRLLLPCVATIDRKVDVDIVDIPSVLSVATTS